MIFTTVAALCGIFTIIVAVMGMLEGGSLLVGGFFILAGLFILYQAYLNWKDKEEEE